MHLHVTDSILKDCLCDTRQPMTFTAEETGQIFYCVNHLLSQLRATFFLNMVLGAQVLSAGNFQCTFKSACFPSLIFIPQSSHLSHHLKQGDINIVFSLTAVHRHTPLHLHSMICTLMLLKLLASYVGLRNSTYCWLCERCLGQLTDLSLLPGP